MSDAYSTDAEPAPDHITYEVPADKAGQPMSPREAAQMLASLRHAKANPAPDPASAAPAAAADEAAPKSTLEGDDAAPAQQPATGETQEADPPAVAPIEPPRSWSKDARERWSKLDPDTQAYLLERDSTDSAAVRKAQNEAAEKLKGLTVKEQQAEQARQQYETALPQLHQVLQAQQAGEFADVRTIADVEKLAREDWPRYLQWDLSQKKIAAVQQEMQAASQRQSSEKQQKFTEFASKEDALFKERVPDMADEGKAAKLQSAALTVLKDIGFDEAELGQSWNGQKDLSLRDHRVQLLIRDATLWRDAQAKAKAATAKPVPPVQRPGAAVSRNAGGEAQIQALTKQLETATGMKADRIAAEIYTIRQRSRQG